MGHFLGNAGKKERQIDFFQVCQRLAFRQYLICLPSPQFCVEWATGIILPSPRSLPRTPQYKKRLMTTFLSLFNQAVSISFYHLVLPVDFHHAGPPPIATMCSCYFPRRCCDRY